MTLTEIEATGVFSFAHSEALGTALRSTEFGPDLAKLLLERIMDSPSMQALLERLAMICHDKCTHQEIEAEANAWRRMARAVSECLRTARANEL